MIDKLKKIQKELFELWRYDVAENNNPRKLTPEQSLELIKTIQTAMSVLRFRDCDSDALEKVMRTFYYEVFERHPLCMTADARESRGEPIRDV
jgi:hypothetical protein